MPNSESEQQSVAIAADEKPELKAGHPPAVKVGNMRVAQRSNRSNSIDKSSGTSGNASGEDGSNDGHRHSGGDGSPPVAVSFAPKTAILLNNSGVLADIPVSTPESVKQFHEKPIASHDFRSHARKPDHIQQPKK